MSEIAELFAELLKDITYEELVQIKAEAEEEARQTIQYNFIRTLVLYDLS